MERKLASIREIGSIREIKDKDRIGLAMVDGWSVIVQKADYNVGDKCVYVECDSVLPDKPEFEFLRNKNFRIKSMKMCGVISQGICFPLSILPKGNYKLGQDVTDIMGIKQYELTMDKEIDSNENKKFKHPFFTKFLFKFKIFRDLLLPKKQNKGFPIFISKTDETRIQNAPFYLDMDCSYVATEKLDGQSGTFALQRINKKHLFFFKKEVLDFSVCSRNYRQWKETNSSYWKVAKKYELEKVLHNLIGDNEWVAIQGECLDTDVQRNKYHVKEADLFVFNLIYPSGRVDSLTAKSICNDNGLKFVPIVSESINLKGMSVKEVLEFATDKSELYNTLREGLVFRTLDGKQSFKAVSPEFLILHDE